MTNPDLLRAQLELYTEQCLRMNVYPAIVSRNRSIISDFINTVEVNLKNEPQA